MALLSEQYDRLFEFVNVNLCNGAGVDGDNIFADATKRRLEHPC